MIALFLALDLGVFHKTNEVPSAKSALKWTGVWFCVAMAFNVAVYFLYDKHVASLGLDAPSGFVPLKGKDAAAYFFSGYLMELSLSLDNIFVIALIFRYFKIAGELQHRVLFWGILGAVVLRVTMILLGSVLIANVSWSIQVFGVILLYTAVKMATSKGDDEFDPDDSRIAKWARRFLPFTTKTDGSKFRIEVDGRRMFTPLFLVLIIVEASDVIFAVDSIPAVFGVFTPPHYADPFIVFTSNIFAILGLRSLYFALASLLRQFAYLKYSLILVLGFIGVKMLVSLWWHPASWISLTVIVVLLIGGILASVLLKSDEGPEEEPPASTAVPPAAPPPAVDDAGEAKES
ncbi:MAG: TerC family protein [Polyangiaceae bacterium]|nr:TerC family protein [Polyangiaceae bacterium]